MAVENEGHEQVKTTDLYWIGGAMHWRIHLVDGRRCEVADATLRQWLAKNDKRTDFKISYRQFALYANANAPGIVL